MLALANVTVGKYKEGNAMPVRALIARILVVSTSVLLAPLCAAKGLIGIERNSAKGAPSGRTTFADAAAMRPLRRLICDLLARGTLCPDRSLFRSIRCGQS